jgi:ribosomal protein S8E
MSFLIAGGAAASLIGGFIGSGGAKKRRRAAEKQRREKEKQLNHLETTRQAVINPYAGVTSLADMAKDLSGELSNPFANLGVATKAAEIQIEQSDIALANTLDTLRSTGAGAGGATALAQAALKSKQGVASSIEQQEAANEKMKAQGKADLESKRMAEKQRVQGVQISEGAREQQAQAQGKAFEFNATEQRQTAEINRTAGQLANAEQQKAQAQADESAAWAGAFSGVGSALTAGIGTLGE